jgi:hypothetical protein
MGMWILPFLQAHYTQILLRDMAGIDMPSERILSQTVSGRPKSEVLAMLAERHEEVVTKNFVEDNLGTLEKVSGLFLVLSVMIANWAINGLL